MPTPFPSYGIRNPAEGGMGVFGFLGPSVQQGQLYAQQQQDAFGEQKKQATYGAIAAVTAAAAAKLKAGVPPERLYNEMLSDPAFIKAFTDGADPNEVVKGISDTILQYSTPKVLPNLGPGEAPGTQKPGQNPVYGTPNPTTAMQNYKAGVPADSNGPSEEFTALTEMVAKGVIPQSLKDAKLGGLVFTVPHYNPESGVVNGSDVVDVSTGRVLYSFDPKTNLAAARAFPVTPSGSPQGGQGTPGGGSSAPGTQTGAGGAPGQPTAVSPMEPHRRAISAIESGGPDGNYNLVGPSTNGDRPYGRYQVMGANIPSWTQEVLGTPMTPRQFLASPAAQDAVFDAKFQQFIARGGSPAEAASIWFSGGTTSERRGAKDVLGTSVESYVRQFQENSRPGATSATRWVPNGKAQPVSASGKPEPQYATSDGKPLQATGAEIRNKMFLGAGAIPMVGELVEGIGGNISGDVGKGDFAAQRNAIRGYATSLAGLADLQGLSVSESQSFRETAEQALGPFTNPRDQVQRALLTMDALDTTYAQAKEIINNNQASSEVKSQAAKRILGVTEVFANMPPRSILETQLAELKAGGGGQVTPGSVVPKLQELFGQGQKDLTGQGVIQGAKPAPQAAAPAQATPKPEAGSRIKQIQSMGSATELNAFVAGASPPLTDEEFTAAVTKLDTFFKK